MRSISIFGERVVKISQGIYMDWYKPKYAYNIVRDFNKDQGTTNPSDLNIQMWRDLNVRYITVENSSERPVSVAIATYLCGGPTPVPQMTLGPGEIRHVAINDTTGPAQFIHIIDPETRKAVGSPTVLRTDANQFVLRDGINKWFVTPFRRSRYFTPQH